MNMFLSIILIFISAVAKGFCDKILFQPDSFWFESDWWLGFGKYRWDKRTWWTKYIFSFVSDGWHLMDAIRVTSLCLSVIIGLQISVFWLPLVYLLHGLVFEGTYGLDKVKALIELIKRKFNKAKDGYKK